MPPHSLRLLALDGGGVRGLSSLIILARLMERVDPDNPPKPCEYFDMIGGTSTGGLIAIMLGRLRLTVRECIMAYTSLSERIFRKSASPFGVTGKIKSRFSTNILENTIKEIIVRAGLPENESMEDTSDSACKVFVCATAKKTSKTVCLKTYKSSSSDDGLLGPVQIWQACRATSAAPTYFDSIALGSCMEEFVDGAIGANNPIQELWNEAQSVWGSDALKDKVRTIVSIGTGIPPPRPLTDNFLGMVLTLAAIATDTEQTAQRFQRDKWSLYSSGRYFRFSVPQGLQNIGLDEWKKLADIAAVTRDYMNSGDVLRMIEDFVGVAPMSQGER